MQSQSDASVASKVTTACRWYVMHLLLGYYLRHIVFCLFDSGKIASIAPDAWPNAGSQGQVNLDTGKTQTLTHSLHLYYMYLLFDFNSTFSAVPNPTRHSAVPNLTGHKGVSTVTATRKGKREKIEYENGLEEAGMYKELP